MANGYPLSAIVGSKKIMKYMEEIFFSSTFAGDTIALAASIATISKIEKLLTIDKVNLYGSSLIKELNLICKNNSFFEFMRISNIDWWPQIIIDKPPIDKNLFLSLMRQEFLKSGLFINSTFNLCYAHTEKSVLKNTVENFNASIIKLKDYLNSKDPKSFLKGDLVQTTFKVR